jgi:hypothetical protein
MFINTSQYAAPSHEVQEQEFGTYIFPNEQRFEYGWVIWLWEDGSADVYTKRNPKTGALLGKPIHLSAPIAKFYRVYNTRV